MTPEIGTIYKWGSGSGICKDIYYLLLDFDDNIVYLLNLERGINTIQATQYFINSKYYTKVA